MVGNLYYTYQKISTYFKTVSSIHLGNSLRQHLYFEIHILLERTVTYIHINGYKPLSNP